MPDNSPMKTWVVIDCGKTRRARDQWLSKQKDGRLKNLGSANQLSRILGTKGGIEADYARVRRLRNHRVMGSPRCFPPRKAYLETRRLRGRTEAILHFLLS